MTGMGQLGVSAFHGPEEFDGVLDALIDHGFTVPFEDRQANRDALARAFVTAAKLRGLRIRVDREPSE